MSQKQDRPRTRSVTASERKKDHSYESEEKDCTRGSASSEWPKVSDTVDLVCVGVDESTRENTSSVVLQPVTASFEENITSNLVEENPGNLHRRVSYNSFNIIKESENEAALQYQRSCDQQALDRDRWFQLNFSYPQYVRIKNKRVMRVTLSGIDKCSKKYFPNRKRKEFYNLSYCIKTIGNTFVNHILGTIGFTVAEYYGLDFINTQHTSYNIVQVVHGVSFTRSLKILSRWKYRYTNRQHLPGKAFRVHTYYSPLRNNIPVHSFIPALRSSTFHIVNTVGEYPITKNYYKSIKEIYNINAVPHDGVPVPVPNKYTNTYDIDKEKYRIYCMYLSSLKPTNTFSIFKYIYPVPLDKIIKDNIIIPIVPVVPVEEVEEVPEIPLRPVNIRDHHQQKLRYWQFKQYSLWTKIGDLQNTTEEQLQTLYPKFSPDFYNVKYMLTRK
jgi:hypothetical protein